MHVWMYVCNVMYVLAYAMYAPMYVRISVCACVYVCM